MLAALDEHLICHQASRGRRGHFGGSVDDDLALELSARFALDEDDALSQQLASLHENGKSVHNTCGADLPEKAVWYS